MQIQAPGIVSVPPQVTGFGQILETNSGWSVTKAGGSGIVSSSPPRWTRQRDWTDPPGFMYSLPVSTYISAKILVIKNNE